MQSNLLRGLEFSIMNLTSPMFLGIENPTVSGMKRKRIPVMMMRNKQMSWYLKSIILKVSVSGPQSTQFLPEHSTELILHRQEGQGGGKD